MTFLWPHRSLNHRQEDSLDLCVLRGAKHLLNSSYRRSTLRIHALPADPQLICSVNGLQGGRATMERDLIPTTSCI